jgi:hypothetical protein
MATNQPNYKLYGDVDWQPRIGGIKQSELYTDWSEKVERGTNDYIIVVSAASDTSVSGVGKTTLALNLARIFDRSPTGFSAYQKSTLDPTEFSREILADGETVADRSAVIFDEAQGTMSGTGADSRRSMAESVMNVSTALATLRYRQLTAILVVQNPEWIDKRIDQLSDRILIIQEPSNAFGYHGHVFKTYYNDLTEGEQRYTERMDTITWRDIPSWDIDKQRLDELKAASARDDVSEEEDQELPKTAQKRFAQEMRDRGLQCQEIAESDLISYSDSWVSKHTEAA